MSAPDQPYVAVIFTNERTGVDDDGYAAMAARMDALAAEQPGYLGIESARTSGGTAITVSYWATDADARAWKQVGEHAAARSAGKDRWYARYHLRVATVTREYQWERPTTLLHAALPDDWAAAQALGSYTTSTRGVTLEEQGYIHCSFDHQVLGVADRFYADLDELVLLRIDPDLLGSEVVVEPPFPGSVEHFPHIYGPIPVAAVIAATPWHRTTDRWSDPPG